MKLKIRDAISIYNGLNALDGVPRNPQNPRDMEYFELGGETRLKIAKNKNRLKEIIETAQEAERGVMQQYVRADRADNKGDTVEEKMALSARKFERDAARQEEQKKIMDGEEDIKLIKLDIESLNLDKNKGISASVLEMISPIIKGVPEDVGE